MAEAGTHDCETQKNEISTLLKTSLKKGDTWYLIDTKWFKQWKKYVGYDNWDTSYVGDPSAYPGPIDNSPLLKGEDEGSDVLKEHLVDELDYILVPEDAWQKLKSWYNLVEGQSPILRKVIEQGMFVKHCKVEVYLMDLKLCQNNDIENLVSKQFSRADSIEYIEKEMRRLFDIETEKEVRLWNKYMSNTYEHLNKPENTVQDAGLYQGQVIVIEQKNDDGTWPRQAKSTLNTISNYSQNSASSGSSSQDTTSPAKSSGSSYNNYGSGGYGSSSSSSYNYSSYNEGYRSTSAPGLCGLSNLGNTCFMNSAIQCMMNVPQLTQYMLNDEWKQELNYDNPLGMRGEIATSYAELCKLIWSGKYSYTVPRNFKVSVGRFQPQFSGYQQQDSQELMAFLLDGLHEDLNRIKNKPYIELKDVDERADEDVAKDAWDNYLKRNDSIIVDIFHGLLKSTLVCPECHKISVTFDPFCYLSLPLPIKKERQIEVFLIRLDPSVKPKQYKLTVPKMGIVSDLCKALAKLTGIDADKMCVTDVYNHRFHKIFDNGEGLSHILDRDDIFVYETPVAGFSDPETAVVPVYMREQRAKPSYNYTQTSTQLFGQPLLIPVPRKSCTYETLYNSVMNKICRYVRMPDDNEEWWKKPADEETSEPAVNGEMETTEDSDTSEEKQSVTNGSSDETEDENVNDREETKPRMFTFHSINSYGSSEVEKIKDDGKPIKLSGRAYLAMDWHARAKELFYDDKAAEDLDVDDSVNTKPWQKKQVIQLTDCLDLFTTKEKLGEQDPWYCPRCKKHQQATKKFDLWQVPNILVIHLKRFSYNRYWRDKLDTLVEYPTKGLNMKRWLINSIHTPAVYDLLAVSNHYGGMGGGHYTAYGKNKDDSNWYNFDDSSVSSSAEDAVVTKAGYVLVYQRRDVVPEPGRVRSKAPSAAGAAGSECDMVISNGEHSSSEDMDTN